MASPSKAGAALTALREDLVGDVFAPGDPGYDEARAVFNSMIDRRPAVIAQCADEDDVVRAVRFGRGTWTCTSRCGAAGTAWRAWRSTTAAWWSTCGTCARSASIRTAEAVRVAGGATIGDLDRACRPHGLATTGGRASTTGVGGFVLGGGSGWLDRGAGWPSTTCSASSSSPPTASGSTRTPTRTRSCSGACTAVAATSASRPRSPCGSMSCPSSPSRCSCTCRSSAPRSVRTFRRADRLRPRTRRAAPCCISPARPRSSYRRTWSARSCAVRC